MSIPSWITALQDPVLRADFTTFYDAGTITETEMSKALMDLAGQNASSGATLSQSQFADLILIAENIGASMGASSYLQFIVNAFVHGNAANASFTGGGQTTIPLGNLKVGYSNYDFMLLIEKWFSGTDLPSDTLSLYLTLNNASPQWHPFTVDYSLELTSNSTEAPLYGLDGPSMSDVNQKYLGDCYLMAPLAEVARQNPAAIENMITPNGGGTYGVRFFWDGVARYVTVDSQLADGGTEFNTAPNIWASIVESAYAQIEDQGVITGLSLNDGNSYTTIGNGGEPWDTLEEITDATEITNFCPNITNWNIDLYNQSLAVSNPENGLSTASVLSTLVADLLVGNDLVLFSRSDEYLNGVRTLVSDHEFSIYGYDASTGMLELRNPWGINCGSTDDMTFEESLGALLADEDTITADNIGTATSVGGAPVFAASVLQSMSQITSFSVTDSAYNVSVGVGAGGGPLTHDSKLKSVVVNGTAGADVLILTGLEVPSYINMGGNTDAATVSDFGQYISGIATASSVNPNSGYDYVALGAGHATIDFGYGTSGVEVVDNFNPALDVLSFSLNGGSLEQTWTGSDDWISTLSDLTHGVLLRHQSNFQSVTVSSGVATVV